MAAEQARVEELHDRPQVADRILHRRAGEGEAIVGSERTRGPGLLGLGVLDVLRLVEDHCGPGHAAQMLEVAVQQRIARDDEGVRVGLGNEVIALVPADAMVHQDRQVGREALGFLPPVRDHRHGAQQQRRPHFPALAFALQEREGLHGLAEAHVVREAGAEAQFAQEGEPRQAAHLVGSQRADEARWRRKFLELAGAGEAFENLAHPAVGIHAGEFEVARRRLGAEREQGQLAQVETVARPLAPPGHGLADVLGVDLHPLAAHAHEVRLLAGKAVEVAQGKDLVAQGDLPRHLHDGLSSQARRDLVLRIAHQSADLQLLPRSAPTPPRRQHDLEAGLLERGGVVGEEGVGLGRAEVTAGRGGASGEAALDPGRQRRRLGDGDQQEGARVGTAALQGAGAEAARFPDVRGRDGEAGVVRGLDEVFEMPGRVVAAVRRLL